MAMPIPDRDTVDDARERQVFCQRFLGEGRIRGTVRVRGRTGGAGADGEARTALSAFNGKCAARGNTRLS
jgi:hypothetical protein